MIQEVALATSPVLLCGPYEAEICGSAEPMDVRLGFRRFTLGVQTICNAGSETVPPVGMAVSFAHMVLESSATAPISTIEADLYLLRYTRMTRCADPRDYVYSLMGVLQKHFNLQVNYARPFKEVYVEATAAFMRHSRSLDLLMAGQFDREAWPSWVTDFGNSDQRYFEPTCHTFMFMRAFNAAKGATFALRLVDQDAIGISAHFVGTVDQVCQGLENMDAPDSQCRATIHDWHTLYQDFLHSSKSHTLNGALPQATSEPHAFWKTMCIGDRDYSPSTKFGRVGGISFTSWDQYYQHLANILDSTGAAILDDEIWRVPNGMTRTCVFLITSKGYIGVAAGPIALGDQLAILAGCRFPFCVRPSDKANGNAYKLAAPAYVEGK